MIQTPRGKDGLALACKGWHLINLRCCIGWDLTPEGSVQEEKSVVSLRLKMNKYEDYTCEGIVNAYCWARHM